MVIRRSRPAVRQTPNERTAIIGLPRCPVTMINIALTPVPTRRRGC
jgi:hypothetical protein